MGGAAPGYGDPLCAGPLCNKRKVAETTDQHRRYSGNQQRPGLEPGKAVHATNTREHGNGAQKHADQPAEATAPQQQVFHASEP